MKYPIVHAERDLPFHKELKNLLSTCDDLLLANHFTHLDSTLQSLENYEPRLLITDAHLFDEDHVIEVLCQYRNACRPDLKIMVLTNEYSLEYVLHALTCKVDGYLTKDATLDEIYACILDVILGNTYISVPDQFKRSKK